MKDFRIYVVWQHNTSSELESSHGYNIQVGVTNYRDIIYAGMLMEGAQFI